MVAPKKLGRKGNINKNLQVKSALASTEHSQVNFYKEKIELGSYRFGFLYNSPLLCQVSKR